MRFGARGSELDGTLEDPTSAREVARFEKFESFLILGIGTGGRLGLWRRLGLWDGKGNGAHGRGEQREDFSEPSAA